ncbi:MAG: LAGLIDADG family homing endonuclease, partial [Patescibacteria group bacterium]
GEWRTRFITTGEAVRTYKARELLGEIAEAAWSSGDPGVQFDTTINRWHTCPNSGRINASNPCFAGDTQILTNKGLISFEDLLKRNESGEKIRVFTDNRTAENPLESVDTTLPERVMITGVNPVYKLVFSNGMEVKTTENHRFFTKNRGMIRADELKNDDQVVILNQSTEFEAASLELKLDHSEILRAGWGGRNTKNFKTVNLPTVWTASLANYLGYLVGDGSLHLAENATSRLSTASVVFGTEEEATELVPRFTELFESWDVSDYQNLKMPNGTLQLRISRTPVARFLNQIGVSTKKAPYKVVPKKIFEAPSFIQKAFLSGLFTADGCVYNGGKSRYVGLGSASKKLLLEVQQILLAQGIFSRIYETRKSNSTNFSYTRKDGSEVEYKSAEMYDLRISGKSILRFKEQIGFLTTKKQEKLAALLGNHDFYETEDKFVFLKEKNFVGNEFTYNLTEPKNHTYIANGLVVANCSEYMHLDDSACNLASINLLKFLGADGSFMVKEFKQAVQIFILAQDIIVDGSSYPTPKIAKNAHDFRELGLGFANLGAFLMAKGFPYDSPEARAWAGAISSLMSGEAYRFSAQIAGKVGSFEGYKVNEVPMLNVIKKHREASFAIDENFLDDKNLLKETREVWDEVLDLGKENGFRNSQVTVIAPTGTIAFMMGCDTTGIEPDFSLVKMKHLVGGGWMKIVNQAAPAALKTLGYAANQSDEIVNWISERGTVEGAPHIKDEHLAVFDTAVKPAAGKRIISWQCHVKMFAAVQPFISGAISKT